ncbi:hypothetical protein Esti_002095 [Eimeria stiedai]
MRVLKTIPTLSCRQTALAAAAARSRARIPSCHTLIPQGSSFLSPLAFARTGASLEVSLGRIKACRSFTSEATNDSSSSNVSFEPDEVSRRLLDLAGKYCKEGCNISPTQNFESLETRENRPWDCLDTVEFLLDAEDIFGLVIPDEAADGFDTIQESGFSHSMEVLSL